MKPWSRRTQLWRKKELREVRTAISKLESNVPFVVEKNVGALEEEILELKSAISKLESRSHSATPVSVVVPPFELSRMVFMMRKSNIHIFFLIEFRSPGKLDQMMPSRKKLMD